MAALLLGARAAVGFDFDPAAGLLAGQYARHNRLAPALYTGTVAALATPVTDAARFEVVVLNVLPHEIADELEQVIAQLAPGGDLLVSGVLATEAADGARRDRAPGLRRCGRDRRPANGSACVSRSRPDSPRCPNDHPPPFTGLFLRHRYRPSSKVKPTTTSSR